MISEIWRYPVKSMAGERLDSCQVGASGLRDDRRWALIDSLANRAGQPITVREDASLLTYSASVVDGRLRVAGRAGGPRPIADLASLLSEANGRPLVVREEAGANFDDSPILIVNLASILALEFAGAGPLDRRRFRANLYIDGVPPLTESGWIGRRLTAGSCELEVVKPCKRCVVITHDPDTTIANPSILRVLAGGFDTNMGVYCRVTRPGAVSVGDLVAPV